MTAAAKKTPTRIYMVVDQSDNVSTYLVRATSAAQALQHVARNTFTVKVPTQDELIAAGRETEVEDAGAEPEPAATTK